MAHRLRHRQTKGAATVEMVLPPPRHISTPPKRNQPSAGIRASQFAGYEIACSA